MASWPLSFTLFERHEALKVLEKRKAGAEPQLKDATKPTTKQHLAAIWMPDHASIGCAANVPPDAADFGAY